MEIFQYTPDILTPVTQFYNRLIADVPHCYPVKAEEFAIEMHDVTGEINNSDNKLEAATAFVAIQNGAVKAFIHIGLDRDRPKPEENVGAIRFLGYERGARQAGQTVLEKAEAYLKAFNVTRISAFQSYFKYSFYHLEYANLSNALGQVQALLGFNGYHPSPHWIFLDWKNYVVTPMPAPVPVKLSVNWVQGRGQRPDCIVKVYQENEEIGDCCSVSGGEFSNHADAQEWLFTAWLGVEKPFREQGLGKFLLQTALQEMHKIGYRHAAISTRWDDYRALLFYSNFGYRVADWTYDYKKILSESSE